MPAGPRSLVYPAAKRWPPPPKAAAIAARSCVAAGPHAHLEPAVALLLQHRRHVGVARGADDVDQVVGLPGCTPARAGPPAAGRSTRGRRPRTCSSRPSATPEHPEERRGSASSNSACASRAWSNGSSRSRAASRSVSGVVASYWNRPVSVTSPAYRHVADAAVSSPPMASMQPGHDLAGGRRVRIDEPDRAPRRRSTGGGRSRSARGPGWRRAPRRPSRSNEAQSHVTITSGASAGRRRPARAGPRRGAGAPTAADRAARSGTSTPSDAPRASQVGGEAEHRPQRVGVGVHVAREDDLGRAPRSTVAARPSSSRIGVVLERLDDPIDALAASSIVSSRSNRSSGRDLQVDLAAELAAQVRRRAPERGPRGRLRPVVAERPCTRPTRRAGPARPARR